MTVIRQPAVAGTFYPDDPQVLATDVQRYLDQAKVTGKIAPKAIIAPHAGYIYSGPIAATVYKRLEPVRDLITRVILLGPCHRIPVRGIAATGADAYATPLGKIPLDKETTNQLVARFSEVEIFDISHNYEHSLEVHLPFLQTVLNNFSLVPLVVGITTPQQIAEILDDVWGGTETLIVVSSDLSHYLDYKTARQLDEKTSQAIETLKGNALKDDQACGCLPIKGLLVLAKHKNLTVNTLDLRNSGDTAGSKDQVVGYGSWAFIDTKNPEKDFGEKTHSILKQHGKTILQLATTSILAVLKTGKAPQINLNDFSENLKRKGACFVTLKRNGRLRGCIGTVMAYQPLIIDVTQNAIQAAFHDPRFSPLKKQEIAGLQLSVSILSPHQLLNIKDEEDLLDQLRPGIDGLIIEDLGQCALFLPSVWNELTDKKTFLAHLKRKAGLPVDYWSTTFCAKRFITTEIHTADIGAKTDI